MSRHQLHSDDLMVEQKRAIGDDPSAYDGDVILVDKSIATADYADALAFMEEPVLIRLEPSAEKNAAGAFPVWVNGTPAECFINGRWMQVGWLPVGQQLTVKRKVLEVIIRAKTDTVTTQVSQMDTERPNNVIQRFSSPVSAFSILEDRNPRGPAWATEMRRRNY